MKKKNNLILAILIAIASVGMFVTGYIVGYHNNDTKNYEAACLQADFIRFIIDDFKGQTECADIGGEIEESYYEWFQELPNGNFKTKYITDLRQFEDYYWCY